jgi:hypothetical protein
MGFCANCGAIASFLFTNADAYNSSFTLYVSGTIRAADPIGTGTNGSRFITGDDSFGQSLYIASSSATQKRMGFNHN